MSDEKPESGWAARDGEEAGLAGRFSILNSSWNREEGKKWAEKFLARELKRSINKRKGSLAKALRRELMSIAYCVTCGKRRDPKNKEESKCWAFHHRCAECRTKNIGLGQLTIRHCRYCNTTSKREDILVAGKKYTAWTGGNKCDKCSDILKRIELEVKRMLAEKLANRQTEEASVAQE